MYGCGSVVVKPPCASLEFSCPGPDLHNVWLPACFCDPFVRAHSQLSPCVVFQDLAVNQALHVRCSSTAEIVWARLHGFPWWPAVVVKPDGAGFLASNLSTVLLVQ